LLVGAASAGLITSKKVEAGVIVRTNTISVKLNEILINFDTIFVLFKFIRIIFKLGL